MNLETEMKTLRPILQNLDTGKIFYNCSLAFIASEIGKAKITIQRWAQDFKEGKFKKKIVNNWVIHFDAQFLFSLILTLLILFFPLCLTLPFYFSGFFPV